MTSASTVSEADDAVPARAARWLANLLGLSHYCTQATCRRAHRCRGKPHGCIRRYTHRVPRHSYDGAKAILQARLIQEAYAQQIRQRERTKP